LAGGEPVRHLLHILSFILLLGSALAQETPTAVAPEALGHCQRVPPFVRELGVKAPVFSTRARFPLGLLLYEGNEAGRAIQLPSWQSAGRLGPFVIDKRGNLLLLPVPQINTLDNPPEKQNSIYSVDAQTGELKEFFPLPMPVPPSQDNPYGLLAITYDCEWDMLYVASVSGSRRLTERGTIFAISLATKEIIDTLSGIDVLSLLILKQGSSKRLLLGSARRSQIVQLAINERGGFATKVPEPCMPVDSFGELRARKMQWDSASGMLRVTLTEFFYNLVGQTEFREEQRSFELCVGF
jgi:hypothetical protein